MARYTDNYGDRYGNGHGHGYGYGYGDVRSSGPNIYNEEELRIVMVGKTGSGKSATGNTILGREAFESRFSFSSVSAQCAAAHGEVERQRVKIIDSPGLFDTRFDEKTIREVEHCVSFADPGPHVFLLVIKLGRFTEEEKQTVQMIQKVFGADAPRYSMVLFTHGDLLRGTTVEDFLMESKDLQGLVAKYNHQYHVFNNMQKENRSQVTELLHKIRKIREMNGGHHYTTEMFQAAERKIQEEAQRILKEAEEKKRKEQEADRKKIEEECKEKIRRMEIDKTEKSDQEKELERQLEMTEKLAEKQAERLAERQAKKRPQQEQNTGSNAKRRALVESINKKLMKLQQQVSETISVVNHELAKLE